jgi:transcription elongation factor Elf1
MKRTLISKVYGLSGERIMGRRRKKVLRVVRRTLPTVFSCPRCGMMAIRITSHHDETSQDEVFQVACGNTACNERREYRYQTKKANIDVYNTFVDDFARTGV